MIAADQHDDKIRKTCRECVLICPPNVRITMYQKTFNLNKCIICEKARKIKNIDKNAVYTWLCADVQCFTVIYIVSKYVQYTTCMCVFVVGSSYKVPVFNILQCLVYMYTTNSQAQASQRPWRVDITCPMRKQHKL